MKHTSSNYLAQGVSINIIFDYSIVTMGVWGFESWMSQMKTLGGAS